MLVVEARLSVNLTALTIEEVIAKMQRSQVQLLSTMVDELRFAGAPRAAVAPLSALRSEVSKRDPSYFNDAENFREATMEALAVQKEVFLLLSSEKVWEGDAGLGDAGREALPDASAEGQAVVEEQAVAAAAEEGAPPEKLMRVVLRELSLSDGDLPAQLGVDVEALLLEQPLQNEGEGNEGTVALQRAKGGGAKNAPAKPLETWDPRVTLRCNLAKGSALLADVWPALIAAARGHKTAGLVLRVSNASTRKLLAEATVDLDILLSAPSQKLALRLMLDKTQVGRVGLSVQVPETALAISKQLNMAGRMQDVAALCARAGQPKEAKALLKLAHNRRPFAPAESQAAPPVTSAEPRQDATLVPSPPPAAHQPHQQEPSQPPPSAAQEWQLAVAQMLLKSGGDAAWPSTLVALSANAEGAFADLAVRVRREESEAADRRFVEGATVLFLHHQGFQFGKIMRAPAKLVNGRGWYAFAPNEWGRPVRVPSHQVLAVSSGGVGAVLREAAAADKVELVEELLLRGVSPFEADAHASTALHRAAANGCALVCKVLGVFGALGTARNTQNLTPLDLAVQNQHMRARRVFQPSASDKDVEEMRTRARGGRGASSTGSHASEAARLRERLSAARHGERGLDGAGGGGVTPLMLASRHNELDAVKDLITKKGTEGLQVRSPRRCTAMLMAAEEGHAEVMTALLEKRGEANMIDDADADGCTALHLAASNGHVQAVEKLLVHGAKVDGLNKRRETPLFLAAKHGYTNVIGQLIRARAMVTAADDGGEEDGRGERERQNERMLRSPLVAAAQKGSKDAVEMLVNILLKSPAAEAVDPPPPLDASDAPSAAPGPKKNADGRREAQKRISEALNRSAAGGHAKVTRFLLGEADDKSPAALASALMSAIDGDHEAAARMLIAAGSDLDGALVSAASGRLQCVKALLEVARSDAPQIRRQQVIDALPEAMKTAMEASGHDSLALLLLAACVEYKHPISCYLERAAADGRAECVHALLAAGAKDTREKHATTALMTACSKGFPEVVRILLRTGLVFSAVDVRDQFGATALCYAAGFSAEAWLEKRSPRGYYSPGARRAPDAGPTDEDARLECVKALLEAPQANYVGEDGERHALELQQADAALGMARLAGFDRIVALLTAEHRKDRVRHKVRHKFQMAKQQELLLGLEQLPLELELEHQQKEQLERALEARANELRNLMMQHEETAIRMHMAANAASTADQPPGGEGGADAAGAQGGDGMAGGGSSTALTPGTPPPAFDLRNITFATKLDDLDRAREAYLKQQRERALWLHAEADAREKVRDALAANASSATQPPHGADGADGADGAGVRIQAMRRLRGPLSRSPAATPADDGAQRLLWLEESFVQVNDFEIKNVTIGCPEMLATSGVLRYEIELETELPTTTFYWGCSAFGFASAYFDIGDEKLTETVGESRDRHQGPPGGAERETATSWVAHEAEVAWKVGDTLCFVANVDLGWLACCKAGDWGDARVVCVDEAIREGVYPALSARFGSALFRVSEQCKTAAPPEGFWDRTAQLARAMEAGDEPVALALAICEDEHAALKHVRSAPKAMIAEAVPETPSDPQALAAHAGRLLAVELGGGASARQLDGKALPDGVRKRASAALDELGPSLLAPHAALIASRLDHSSGVVRQRALKRLASLDATALGESAVLGQYASQLLGRLDDLSGDVRQAAVAALGKLEASAQAAATPQILRRLAATRAAFVRQSALEALEALEPSLVRPHLEAVIGSLADGAHNVRLAALSLLLKVRQEDLEPLTRAIASHLTHWGDCHAHSRTPRIVMKLLLELPAAALAEHAAPALIELVGRASAIDAAETLEAAAEVLAKLEPAVLASRLETVAPAWLTHESATLRKATLEMLAKLEPPALIAQGSGLVRALRDEDSEVRQAAVAALSRLEDAVGLGEAPFLADLVATLGAERPGTRAAATEALHKLAPAEEQHVTDGLVKLLAEPTSDACYAALQVMAVLPAKHVSAWMRCVSDGSSRVQSAALELITTKLDVSEIRTHVATFAQLIKPSTDWTIPSKVVSLLGKIPAAELALHAATIAENLGCVEWAKRQAALQVLARLPQEELEPYAPQVINALGDPDASVREAALDVMARVPPASLQKHSGALMWWLGPEPKATPSAMYLDAIRVAVFKALSRLDPQSLAREADALIRAIADPEGGVRAAAVTALRRLQHAARSQHVPAVIRYLKHGEKDVRYAALEALEALGSAALARHVADLEPLIKDAEGETHVREIGLRALALVRPDALEPLVRPEGGLLIRRVKEDESTVRVAALMLLSRLRQSSLQSAPVLREVVGALKDEEQAVRQAAVATLWSLLPAARERLAPELGALLDHPKTGPRLTAIAALGQLPASQLEPLCEKLFALVADDDECWNAALSALSAVGTATKSRHLAGLLAKLLPKREIRRASTIMLQCGPRAVADHIEKLLPLCDGPKVEAQVVGSVLHLLSTESCASAATVALAAPKVLKLLQHPEWHVRSQAVSVLGRLRGAPLKRHLPSVLRLFSPSVEEDEVPRANAVRVLAVADQATRRQYAPRIADMLTDIDSYVRSSAAQTLAKLTPEALREYAPKLITAMRGVAGSWEVAVYVQALARLEPAAFSEHAAAFVSALTNLDSDGKTKALHALAKQRPPVHDPLVDRLLLKWACASGEHQLAAAAIRALGGFGPRAEHRQALFGQLRSEEPTRRAAAMWAFHRLETSELQSHGEEWLRLVSDESETVREVAVKTLVKLGADAIAEHADALAALLSHEHTGVRASVLRVVAKMLPSALGARKEAIVEMMHEEQPREVQAAALEAMAAFELETLTPYSSLLMGRLEEDDELVTTSALVAIAALPSPPPGRFARHLAGLTEHLRCDIRVVLMEVERKAPRDWQDTDRYYKDEVAPRVQRHVRKVISGVKALGGLSRSQLSFCAPLLLHVISIYRPVSDEVHYLLQRAMLDECKQLLNVCILTLSRLWSTGLVETLVVPKKPDEEPDDQED